MSGKSKDRDTYIEKMEAQLKEWAARLGALDDKTKSMHAKAVKHLEELKQAGEDGWEALKAGVEDAWKELSIAK
jgi:hypothetical protein